MIIQMCRKWMAILFPDGVYNYNILEYILTFGIWKGLKQHMNHESGLVVLWRHAEIQLRFKLSNFRKIESTRLLTKELYVFLITIFDVKNNQRTESILGYKPAYNCSEK